MNVNDPVILQTSMKMKESSNKRKLSCEGKRAAHVKWDGKTIALGTFPDDEAASMCRSAKVLTKAWRSMYPKPTVEWVRQSLERRGIRVVNNRPGRQPTKKEGSPNQKGSTEGEDIRLTQQIKYSSLLSFGTNQSKPIAATTEIPRTESITNIAKVGMISSPSSELQASSIMLALRDPVTPKISNQNPPSIRPQTGHTGNLIGAASKTKPIQTDSLVRDKNEEQLAHPDLEDLDIEMTYATLQRHRVNLKTEVEEIDMLLNFYEDERNRRQVIRERYQKEKNQNLTDQHISMTIDPIPMNQATHPLVHTETSMKIKPIAMNHAPNPSIHATQFDDVVSVTNRPEDTPELCAPMDDAENNVSTVRPIELEDWRCQ